MGRKWLHNIHMLKGSHYTITYPVQKISKGSLLGPNKFPPTFYGAKMSHSEV